MILRNLKTRLSSSQSSKAALRSSSYTVLPFEPGRTVYAIGDIHGRIDLLDRMLWDIAEDMEDGDCPSPVVVFLGDYVDRGSRSAEVLEHIVDLLAFPPWEVRFLKGNHEAMMLGFMDDPVGSPEWLQYGGLSTLLSYGVGNVTPTSGTDARLRVAEELRGKLPTRHLMFLRMGMESHFRSGNVFFCHAAIDRNLPLDAQEEATLFWGAQDFIERGGPSDTWIVHGHTVFPEPDFGYNRLGIDTGAYHSGRLTAARISDGGVRFLVSK